jgi:hypothetical protein
MTSADAWVCRVCWKLNRPRDESCWKCKTVRGVDEAQAEVRRKAIAARAAQPGPVPDLVVALPVVIFRSYGRVWIRGGIGLFGLLALIVFGGVTDVVWLVLTGGFAAGLVLCGFLAGEVSEGMRDRELWAFVVGVVLSVVAVIGSVSAFEIFAPGLVNPNAIRWGSVIVFGGAGVAALGGLVLLVLNRNTQEPEPARAGETTPEP